MPKNSFQDVVPPGGARKAPVGERSIRNIPVMRTRKSKSPETFPTERYSEPKIETSRESYEFERPAPEDTNISPLDYPPIKEKRSFSFPKFSSKFFIGSAVVAILAFVFIMMSAFTSASVELTPKSGSAAFNTSIKIRSADSPANGAEIPYQVIKLSAQKEKEIPASGEEDVEYKASAKITIYNNFSPEPQRLITRTRFETAEGLIFRIADSVTIPGKTSAGPGSIEVTVYADEAGEKYNIGLSDFTIPGFKSDAARYKGFYARSVTKATGGFIGKAKKVNEADKALAIEELRKSLVEDLEKDLSSKIDEASIVLSGAILYDFKEVPTNSAVVTEEAKAYAIALNKKELGAIIKKNFLAGWEDLDAEVLDWSKVKISFDEASWRPERSPVAGVKIEGEALFVASIDTESIKEAIAGKPRSELVDIINNSASITGGKSSIRPLWKSAFPENASKIRISVVSP